MKKTILIALALLSFQSAFAQRIPGGPGPMPGGRDDLPMCLKNLDNANRRYDNLQNQMNDLLRRCNQSGPINGDLQRQNDDLRNQVASLQSFNNNLSMDNSRLQSDNRELRRQLDEIRNEGNRTLGFYSFAGCKDFSGNIDFKYISSGEGRVNLESETNAKQKVAASFSCSYGIIIGGTEEIRSIQPNNYCVAGCKDFSGNVDQKYIKSGTGRNVTEASYNAMKAVSAGFTCSYGIKIQACQ